MSEFVDKKTARCHFLEFRASMTAKSVSEQGCALCDILLALPQFISADSVLLFSSTRNEPDLNAVAKAALSLGKTVAYPISHTDTYTLSFHSVNALTELTAGAYGIPEPPATADAPYISPASICIVPALAYDRQGYRLGYGKGYYDRFLDGFCGITVGVAMDGFICDLLPHDSHDIPLDIIITKTGVIYTNEASFS